MKAYYEQSGITIYHADCREVLPTLGKVDLILTDPPWGINGRKNSKTKSRHGINFERAKNDYDSFEDSTEYIESVCAPAFCMALEKCNRAILTPGNRCLTLYPQPDSFGVFWQPASVGLQSWGRADSQPIFYYGKFPRESKKIPGQNLSWQLTKTPEDTGHPCGKPFRAWARLLHIGSIENETVLDLFTGSGTTLVAAKLQGRKAIGIEISERYCEIAANRIRLSESGVISFAAPARAQESNLFPIEGTTI